MGTLTSRLRTVLLWPWHFYVRFTTRLAELLAVPLEWLVERTIMRAAPKWPEPTQHGIRQYYEELLASLADLRFRIRLSRLALCWVGACLTLLLFALFLKIQEWRWGESFTETLPQIPGAALVTGVWLTIVSMALLIRAHVLMRQRIRKLTTYVDECRQKYGFKDEPPDPPPGKKSAPGKVAAFTEASGNANRRKVTNCR